MLRVCKHCGQEYTKGSYKDSCINCYMKNYFSKNKGEKRKSWNQYMREYTKDHNKTFVYFAVYEDGLYIGSTYWGIQRKSYHLNNVNENYTQYIINNKATSFHSYELPNDTSNKYLRLLEAFLINKISPEINMRKMQNHFKFEFSELPLIYKADLQSDEIISWAKSISELSSLL